jgi:adenine/guanine/hypoxanthine permease
LLTAVLHARRVRGSILWGILGATALAVVFKLLLPAVGAGWAEAANSVLAQRFQIAKGIVAAPPSLAPTFCQLDLVHALSPKMLPFIFVFLFMLVFDAIGTLIGVCEQAGFIKDNRLPRARQAMLSDAVGTVAGAALGTSTVTSFIESAAGVEQGGRTGLTGLVVAGCFLLALFFSPLIATVGSYPPITAPALVIVGAMMLQNVTKIDWQDYSESIPAFLTLIGIPLSYSIADGLALGLISYPIIKLFSGKGRGVGWLTYVLAAVLIAYFLLIRSRL